jgi:serine/threonine-protein kinase
MEVEQVLSFLESLPSVKYLDATERLIIRYSWEDKTYEEMAEYITGYTLGFIKKGLAPDLWKKLTNILILSGLIEDEEAVTKKNLRIVLEPIVKLHQPSDLVGKIIHSRFQVKQLLSKGEFGNSYIGEDLHLNNKSCVIKQFKTKSNPNIKIKFERESGALYQLSWHRQIPRLMAHFEDESGYFLVHEFVEGFSLNNKLLENDSSEPWSEVQVVELIDDILNILHFVHQNSIIHRDIKPSNLIKKPDGKIVLINFGSIKQIDNSNKRTFFGTPGYMAPEQSHGTPLLCSDIYGVAILGIQALTGLPPTQFKVNYETGQIIWHEQASVSQKFAEILDKMSQFDWKNRHQSAQEVLQALKGLQ